MFINDKEKTRRLSRWILLMVLLCCIIVLGVSRLEQVSAAFKYIFRVLRPMLVGLIIAYVLNVPYSYFCRILFPHAKNKIWQKLRNPLALLISFVVLLAVLCGVIALVIPELIKTGSFIKDTISTVIQMVKDAGEGQTNFLTNFSIDWENVQQKVNGLIETGSEKLLGSAVSIFGAAAGGLLDLVFSVVFAMYMLVGKERLIRQIKRLINSWLPEKLSGNVLHVAVVMNNSFRSFIVGQVTEAIILGLLCALGMMLLGLPHVLMISMMVCVCALVPIVGAYFSAIVGALLILIVDPTQAIIFLVFMIILQQLEGNLIYPKVVGGKLRLPGIWVLAAVTTGGGLAGPFGMLIGVPVAAGLYVLLKESTAKREASRAKLPPPEAESK